MFEIVKEVPNLSNHLYHSVGSGIISSSFLKGVYKHSVNRAKIPLEPNDALTFGTQFHDICELGIKKFKNMYSVIPDDCSNKRTKLYKEFIKDNPNALTKGDSVRLNKMYNNLNSNEFYRSLEDNYKSHAEHSFYAKRDGLDFRIRPDKHYSHDGEILYVCDFKTTSDCSTFKYDITKYSYDLQAVFYSDVLGINPSDFYFIAIEKTFPYTCQVFGLSEDSIRRGRTKMDIAIDKIKRGEKSLGYDLVQRV
jgi:hypothetical protein